ncbi:hypothetical protein NP493_892g01015 [Ridgeia piscesae]|uniref:Uncharacterized protein n=1 Tax=Ridgeia piscesae TaxID=27915 RepID=A0AAD9KL49_RIDPI|nr:hypothetical protein NP493_892g01015 [Ridgeia piscesae]
MIHKVAAEVRCLQTDPGANAPCQEMEDFLTHIHTTLTTGLNRRLYLTEQELNRRNLEAKWRRDKQADAVERTRKQQRQLRDEQLLRQSTGLRGILRNNRLPLTPPPHGDAPLKDGVKELGGTKASQNWSDKMYYFISHLWDCDIDTLILTMLRPLLTVFI